MALANAIIIILFWDSTLHNLARVRKVAITCCKKGVACTIGGNNVLQRGRGVAYPNVKTARVCGDLRLEVRLNALSLLPIIALLHYCIIAYTFISLNNIHNILR